MKKVNDVTNLDEMIGSAVIQTNNIFHPDVEQLEKFQERFATIVVDEILDGLSYGDSLEERLYGFTSAFDVPTNNMKRALIETGISSTGQIPKGHFFLSTFLPVTGELLLDAQIIKEELAMDVASKSKHRK